ncbi:probable polygalacturonase [Tanacetum coccineum]
MAFYQLSIIFTNVVASFLLLGLIKFSMVESQRNVMDGSEIRYPAINCRKHTAFLTDFGGKGDGRRSNTAVFQAAIKNLSQFSYYGGAQLIVPPGKWLTGSFNLTSHFTLFIQHGATILASKYEKEYPLIEPLPSYGQGRDAPGARFSSLIGGSHLTDVVITVLICSDGLLLFVMLKATMARLMAKISNLTMIDSPSWFVHPVYSSDIIMQDLTIRAPIDSPNTDGIDPAVKSGWDQYGIRFGMPTQHMIIRRLTCISPDSAVIALGSEMSGGIKNIRAEDITAINSQSAIRIKTAPGRGGYVKDIFVNRMNLQTMKYVFWTTGSYGQHTDSGYDPNALPKVERINYKNVVAKDVKMAGNMGGIDGDPFTGFCLSNITIGLSARPKPLQWNCTNIYGVSSNVTPRPCDILKDKGSIEVVFRWIAIDKEQKNLSLLQFWLDAFPEQF